MTVSKILTVFGSDCRAQNFNRLSCIQIVLRQQTSVEGTSEALEEADVLTEISSSLPAVLEVDFLYWGSDDAVKTDEFMDNLNSQ